MGKAQYISFSGVQYVDTGFKPNNNTRVIIDIEITSNGTFALFGTRDSSSVNSFVFWQMSNVRFRTDYGASTSTKNIDVSSTLGRFTIDKNKNNCKANETSAAAIAASTFQCSNNLFILAMNTGGTLDSRMVSGNLYSCKIYDNDILIRDYIPWCDENGVYCLKDVVNNTLNYSASSTAFTGMRSDFQVGDVLNFPYSGAKKSITLPAGKYKLEVWGAQGGYRSSPSYGGLGGYSVGTINLDAPTTVYVYAGGAGNTAPGSSDVKVGGFNGGGYRYACAGGGGASDIRIGQDSLYARVIVAGGGGSDGSTNNPGKYGGGTSGGSATESFGSYGYGGTQTGHTTSVTMPSTQPTTNSSSNYPGGFGFGGFGIYRSSGYGGAGGGGWYGGCGSYPDGSGDDDRGGGGGSGYVYTSSTASNYPSGCLLNSSYYLTDAATYAGNTSFTGTGGSSETGHSGNGYCRITVIELYTSFALNVNIGNIWKEVDSAYVNIDGTWKEIEGVWANIGGSWKESG